MRSRWIAWSLAACAIASVAHADEARRGKRRARAAPVAAPAISARRDARLASLARDPALARADRIDGKGVRHMVAFTFDDGPSPDTTPAILDALARYDVPATFFIVTNRLTGRQRDEARALLAREVAAGYLVATHSVSHRNLRLASTRALHREIDRSLETLAHHAGHPIGMFRPPYGALDDRGRAHLQKRGLTEVRWSIDTEDWQLDDPSQLRTRTLASITAQEGGVVLMHDVKEVTARSIALILDDLEASNCARLAANTPPILPVSLHYWLRDAGRPRPIPPEVTRRTESYRRALPARCAARKPTLARR